MAEKLNLSEDQLQAQCFQWHWNTYPNERQMLFHCQQKARNAIEGNRFKAMGVVRGVSDLILILRNGRVIFIELKYSNGTQKAEQKTFEQKVCDRGHTYVIIKTFEDFKIYITFIYA